MYKELFNKLLDEGYNLYITDIIKLWNKSKSKNLNVTAEDEKVLNEELKILSGMYEKIHILHNIDAAGIASGIFMRKHAQ